MIQQFFPSRLAFNKQSVALEKICLQFSNRFEFSPKKGARICLQSQSVFVNMEDNFCILDSEYFCLKKSSPVPLRSHEADLIGNPIVTLNTFAAFIYLGFYFTFVGFIAFHQLTVSSTGNTDICAAQREHLKTTWT